MNRRTPVVVELLENRRLLAGDLGVVTSATLDANGILTVSGTPNDDYILVDGVRRSGRHHPDPNSIRVSNVKTGAPGTGEVLLEKDFAIADVKGIVVYGGDGVYDALYVVTTDPIPTTVYGGNGQDGIIVQNGADNVIYGGDGFDYISAGDGNDSIFGQGNKDDIRGNGGNDLISGGGGNDALYGGDGRDRIYGGIGNDFLFGQAQADRLFGQDGNDTLNGGGGNDSLDGGAGNDSMLGSYGDDHFTANDGEADTLDGGDGSNDGTFDDVLDTVDNLNALLPT